MTEKSNTEHMSIWEQILGEADTQKALEESHVFVFGDKNSGKKSLIKNIDKDTIQNHDFNFANSMNSADESASKYCFLDYKYLNVKESNSSSSENEILTKMHVWMINTLVEQDFIDSAFRPEYLLKALFIVTVDRSNPTEIIEQLKRWCTYFYEKFSPLLLHLPVEKQRDIAERLENYLKLWEENNSSQNENNSNEMTDETIQLKLELPLKEGLLKLNMGIPVIFLINKSDVASNGRCQFKESSEFIFKHIRKFALAYGAATLYTSTKTNINIELLYDYLLHRLYNFDFKAKPNIFDKESYFIPAGYDSLNILKSYDTQNDIAKSFNECIKQTKRIANSDEEITCEDSQHFIKKFYGKGMSNYSVPQTQNLLSVDEIKSRLANLRK